MTWTSVDLCSSLEDAIRYCFDYRDDTGELLWRERTETSKYDLRHNRNKANTVVSNTQHGYGRVNISYRGKVHYFKTHRLIWYLVYGYWADTIDHKDGDGLNNKIDNLRECSPQENAWNRKPKHSNKSGIKGVDIILGKFRSRAYKDGKRYSLGTFNTLEEAKKAYEDFCKPVQKEYYRGQ